MGELEAVGDVVTGGLLSTAAEPSAGEKKGHGQEKICLNCGCDLVGTYCHCCGQKAHVHRTLRAFGHDLLHGALHFEGKIWHTLPLLVWKPGELTRRYIDGERAKFVSPVALFLFTVFLMFAILSLTGAFDETGAGSGQETVGTDLAEARDQVAAREADGAEGTSTAATSDGTPVWVEGFLDKASANPELLFYKLKTNAYKFSWALIPISVPFVWLLFPFSRQFRAYDHTVFVTYSLCFMMLLLIVGGTVGLVWPTIATLLFFVPPFHMYRQLKGTYGLGRGGAFWRTTMLVGFSFAAIGMFVTLIVGAGEV